MAPFTWENKRIGPIHIFVWLPLVPSLVAKSSFDNNNVYMKNIEYSFETRTYKPTFFFFREFQLMTSAFDDSSLLDFISWTNWIPLTYKPTNYLFFPLFVNPTWIIYLFCLTFAYFSYYLQISHESPTYFI